MRSLLLVAALVAAPTFAQPETDVAPDVPAPAEADAEAWRPTARGVRTLGGSVGASRWRFGDTSALSVSAQPAVGAFITDGLLVALTPGVGYSRSFGESGDPDQPYDFRSSSVSASLGPAVTKYFGAPEARAFPFIGASAQLFAYRSRSESQGTDLGVTSDWFVAGDVRGGVMVPIARNVAIQAQLSVPVFNTQGADNLGSAYLSAGIATFLY